MVEGPLRVLVLDDDPEDVELIEDLLQDARALDVEVAAVHTTRGALERLDEGTVDVLLVDYRLGAESGVDFIEHPLVVRSRVPAILMTGVGTPEIDREALEAGAVDYLPKDELTSEHLSRSLRYAVERRSRQRVEARLDALIGNARELVSIVDTDGAIQYVSPSLQRVLGFDPDEKVGLDAREEVHPDDREKVAEALRTVFEEGGSAEVLYRVRDAEGGWRWLDTKAESHVQDPDISGVVVSSWDVTDRILAQRNVRFQAELLDAVGQAVIATDTDGEVLYWNPAAEDLYGWKQEEVLGSDIMDLTVHQPRRDQATKIMEALQRGETWHGEFEVRRKDGSTFTALVANSPLVDAQGRLVGIIGASSDITAIKRTEHELTERIKELRTLNQTSMLLNRSDLSMDERLRRIVESLPGGWLCPEHTEARLTLPGRTMATEGFRETAWMQSVDVSTDDGEGRLEIALTGGVPADTNDPFLGEEYELLDSVGSMIQQALERSSVTTLLTQAFASLQEAILVVGTERVIQYANPVAEEMFGHPLDELLGTTTEKLHVDSEAFHRFAREGDPRLEEDGVFFADYEMRRRDGEVFAAEQTVSLLDRARGLEGGAVSVIRDISEQRAAEAELIEKEQRFREITEAIDDVFWVSTPEKVIEYLSPAFEQIWGRPVKAAYEDRGAWLEAVVPADRERVRRFVERQPEAHQTEEYGIRRPDGEERYILDRSFPVRSPDGTLERIIGVARDITEERRLEERFGILSQEISDVIYVLAPDGTVLTSSPSVLEATGYTREEFEGSDALDMVHPDDREEVRSALASVVTPPDGVARAEYRIVTKSGSTIYVESVARNLVDNPAVGGILITTRDVTERHELERRVRQMQKMESVGRLAGGVAHDFNNILTVIRSQADLILMEKPEQSVAEDVTVIQDAADRAARLTKQLLAFSREQVMQPRNVDLGDVVRGTSDLIQRLIGEQIRVRYQVATDLATVRVDPNHMEQVLVNLAVNARDAMSTGGEMIVSVQEQRVSMEDADPIPDLDPGHYVAVRVRDTGMGMTPDTLQRIFEPFFTTKAKGEGTGLGLAMVYGTVRQSGGSIQVESAPGKGTTFHLYFPVVDGEKDEEGLESREKARETPRSSESVLVVEDDPQVRTAARRVLENAGFRVTEVDSAEAALAHLAGGGAPDVILTDLVLEGMRGYDLMEEVSASWSDIPIVVMSGYAHGSPGRKGLPSGVPFVQKPFTPSGLVGTIREALARGSADR